MKVSSNPASQWTRLLTLAVAAPWIPWIGQMRFTWSSAPEHYFGWAVPALAAFLAWLRWRDRPPPCAPVRTGLLAAWCAFGVAVVGLAGFSILMEPNPLWTAASWGACLSATAMTLLAAYVAGGARWVRHFAWPSVFVLSSLVWPAWVEVPLMAHLKASIAALAAELVSVSGHPAIAHGSAIELARGMVGVEDACSGIRSLQTAIMVALFLGELLRLPGARRLVLAIGSVALAFAANLARTVFLAWCVAAHGASFAARVHDGAGMVEVILALAGVFTLALLLEGRRHSDAPAPGPARRGAIGAAWAVALVAGAAIAPLGVAMWYSPSDYAERTPFVWSLKAPDASWRPVRLSEVAAGLLSCDRVEYLRSGGPGAGERVAAHLVWDRDPAGRYVAGLHHPDVCLPNAGARLVARVGPCTVRVAGRKIVFDQMEFDADGLTYQVFFAVWDSSRGGSIGIAENNAVDFGSERWRLVREHRRRLVMEQLTFAFGGVTDPVAARAELGALLPAMLSRGHAP